METLAWTTWAIQDPLLLALSLLGMAVVSTKFGVDPDHLRQGLRDNRSSTGRTPLRNSFLTQQYNVPSTRVCRFSVSGNQPIHPPAFPTFIYYLLQRTSPPRPPAFVGQE